MLTYFFTPLDYSTASGVIQWSNPEVKIFTSGLLLFFFCFYSQYTAHETQAPYYNKDTTHT